MYVQRFLIFCVSCKPCIWWFSISKIARKNKSICSYTAQRYSLSSWHFGIRGSVLQSLAKWIILILHINKHNKWYLFQPWCSHTNELIKQIRSANPSSLSSDGIDYLQLPLSDHLQITAHCLIRDANVTSCWTPDQCLIVPLKTFGLLSDWVWGWINYGDILWVISSVEE